jgi:hypothetical protein
MGSMSFGIPEGANVQVTVGNAPVLALPDETIRTDQRGAFRCSGGAALKLPMALLLVGGGVLLGWAAGAHHGEATAALPSAGLASPPPVAQAFPVHPPAAAEAAPSPPTLVLPAFAQQLRQAPTVVPALGRPPAGAPHRNAFGLEN